MAGVVLVSAVLVWPARASDRSDDARRLLDLLTGARIAYVEAFDDGGAEMESLTELEEARLLLTEARNLNDRVQLVPPAALAALLVELDAPVGSLDMPDRIAALAADVSRRTGVAAEERPARPASAARGRELYRENCTGCHGVCGAGDGPDAAAAGIAPADFTSVVFMRRETPLDFFTMITLGHRRRRMPEWTALSAQQRWDLVAYVWGLSQSDADRTAGARVWAERCAGCHGDHGTGIAGKANDLGRTGILDERTDRTLFVGLFRGPHATPNQQLSDAERWQVIGHVRALTLGGATPRATPGP